VAERAVGSGGPKLSRGEFGLLILGLLGRREMYGYELVAQLRETSESVIDLPEGTVYPALRRLERDGLIAGRWVEVGVAAPRRRYYSLTQSGERALAEGRTEWKRFSTAADAILGS
jgi:PadR family transcriptional regulator, regulatory protein PadR